MTQELALDSNGKVVETHIEDNGTCPLDLFEFLVSGKMVQADYDCPLGNNKDCKSTTINGT